MKKQSSKIKIIFLLKYFADALFTGYLSMYFSKFFDKFSFEYGLLLGIIPLCAMLGNFLFGLASKTLKRNLFLIKIICSLELLGLMFFVGLGTTFWPLLIFTILISLCNSPSFSFQEGIASIYSKEENVSYTSIRLMGSSGYFLALAAGALFLKLTKNNYSLIFIFAGIIYLICLVMWFFVKPIEGLKEDKKENVSFKEVLKHKSFIVYFIIYLLVIGCNNVGDTYLYARLEEVNISDSIYSLVYALEVLVEVIILLVASKYLKERHYLLVMKIGMSVLLIRNFLFSFNFPLTLLIVFAPLRGIGWGLFLSIHLLLLRKMISSSLVTKGISILTIALSLINFIFTTTGSSIYKAISLPSFYLLLSGVQLIGIIILYVTKFKFIEQIKE